MMRVALLLLAVTFARADNASVEGTVLSDTNSEPLRRAYVVLRSVDGEAAPIGVDADDQGHFAIHDIPPGKYSLLVQRDGYLPSSNARNGDFRLPAIFTLDDGQNLTGIVFRLRPWAVIAGKIQFDDAEPAIGVSVQAYRDVHYRGRHSYVVVGGARTDDHGEYRIHGLPPGSFYLVAVYERPALVPDAEDRPNLDASGKPLPLETYTSTFFPGVYQLAEAVPITLDYGKEISGIDIFLRKVRKVSIRGRVTSGLSGQVITNPAIVLERTGVHGTGGLSLPVNMTSDKQGRFELKNVTPGPYVLDVEASEEDTPLLARVPLTVSEAPIDDLDIVAQPEQSWKGRVRAEGSARIQLGRLRISLEPRSPRGAVVTARVDRDGSFKLALLPDEVYDLYVDGAPLEFFVKSVQAANNDLLGRGVSGSYASDTVPLTVTLSSTSAHVTGRVYTSDASIVPGANLMLIPDPPGAGRYQAYRSAIAGEYAYFDIRGVGPGRYLLVTWTDEPPCDFYDPASLDRCRPYGVPVSVEGANNYDVPLELKADQRY